MAKPMLNNKLVDFYRGWMLEIVKTGEGLQSFYHSPDGERLSDGKTYFHPFQAKQSAIELIDQFFACYALSEYLREAYELSLLSLDEWQQMNEPLVQHSRKQFVRSYS
jgi:hypothetical protein